MKIEFEGQNGIKVESHTFYADTVKFVVQPDYSNLTNTMFMEMAKNEYLRGFLKENLRQIFQEAVDEAVLNAVRRLTDPEDTFGQLR